MNLRVLCIQALLSVIIYNVSDTLCLQNEAVIISNLAPMYVLKCLPLTLLIGSGLPCLLLLSFVNLLQLSDTCSANKHVQIVAFYLWGDRSGGRGKEREKDIAPRFMNMICGYNSNIGSLILLVLLWCIIKADKAREINKCIPLNPLSLVPASLNSTWFYFLRFLSTHFTLLSLANLFLELPH